MPNTAEALAGRPATNVGPGRRGDEWLFSAVPVPSAGWAVVVQRPAADALGVVNSFSAWLAGAAVIFGAGGLLFWLVLMRRVIRPLHALAAQHQALPQLGLEAPAPISSLPGRDDEVGVLARSLQRLERDVTTRLAELHTPLETSNAVVGTLDPRAVAQTIIHLQTISGEADRLAQLVCNLLDLARIEAGLLPLQRAAWRLDTLVAGASSTGRNCSRTSARIACSGSSSTLLGTFLSPAKAREVR